MKTHRIEGWLFDVDELGSAVALWIYDLEGRLHRLTHAFNPPIYVGGGKQELGRLSEDLIRQGLVSNERRCVRREFWSGKEIEVLQLSVTDASILPKLREMASALDEQLSFYNLDIQTAQYFLYLSRLFPLCRLECLADERRQVVEIRAINDAYDLDHPTPPVRIMKMRGERMQPLNARSRILIECKGETRELAMAGGVRVIHELNALIHRFDPDLILSERGDTVLLPALLALAKREKLPLQLDRDQIRTERKIETEGRSIMTYGQVIYKGPSYPLFGRWHVDRKNSFAYHETDLEGLLELARLAQIPVQRMARRSPGTAMSSIELERAVRDGVLVPWRKIEPEQYKTALKLLTVDKGGLSFQPQVGVFEGAAEIDFASMYPSLMDVHNISPETVLCACCENSAVPEAGYNICEKRRGLIPLSVGPLVERRRRLKERMRVAPDALTREMYEARRTALKWMLVSCFGYMGYRNAKFGRIEAHESVTAFGREALLRAKEMVEQQGFEVLHALTDSLWISKAGANEQELRTLCDAIKQATRVEMSLEGAYRWIVFLSSKMKSGRPVATRYFGVFQDGTLKTRGLAHRRRDSPIYVKEVQEEMLAILSQARTIEEFQAKEKEALVLLERRIAELLRGEVDIRRLIIEQVLSRAPEEYAVQTRTAIAAQQLRDAGVPVHPGESVGYIITNAKARKKSDRIATGGAHLRYDEREYVKRLQDAGKEICPFSG
jgi:DNA polymerase elongation subunit (family B)